MLGFPDFFHAAIALGLVLTSLALILAFTRLVLGPTLADRVVALDLVTMILVVKLVMFALLVDVGAYIDGAIALALVGFLATVAFARYIDRAPRPGPVSKGEPEA